MKIELSEALTAPQKVAIDLETSGLDWLRDTPLLMGIYGEGFSGYFNFFDYSGDQLREFFKQFFKGRSCILHNAKFDFHFLRRYADVEKISFSDTMLLSQIIDENTSHKLEYLSEKLLGSGSAIAKKQVNDIMKEIRSKKKVKSWTEVPNHLLGARAEEDCRNTYNLYNIFRPQMYNDEIYTLEKDLLRRLITIEANGVLLDVEYLHKLEEDFSEKIDKMRKKYPDMNINSSVQIAHRIYDIDGFRPIVYTEKGKPSADSDILKTIDSDFARDMVEYKVLNHTYSTYIRAFLEQMDSQNRLHCNFKQLGARTGRLSCVNPNLQQVPKFTPLIRRAFIGSENLCTFDYSQMEAILYVLERKEKYLMQALDNNKDIYQTIAAKLYSKRFEEVDSDERNKIKEIVLGIIYGMGQTRFGNMTSGMKLSQVKEFFKELNAFKKEIEAQIRDTGYVETEFGRRRHLSNEESYKGINARIQGTAADILKMSIIALPKELLNKFRITVHDENIFENLEMDEIVEIKKLMTQFKEKLKVRAGMGKNWWDASCSPVEV